MRLASSRERTSPTSFFPFSQIANSTIDAVSGIGKKYVPSSVYGVSFLKTCSTCVVATCVAIFTSMLIDLTGKAFGSGRGRGLGPGQGRISQMIGTMFPCAGVSDGSAPNAMMIRTARLKYFTEGSFVRREG